jgi:hypothetical protein
MFSSSGLCITFVFVVTVFSSLLIPSAKELLDF